MGFNSGFKGLTEMSSRADNLTTLMCRLSWNLGFSIYRNPQGLSRPLMGLYLYLYLQLIYNLIVSPDTSTLSLASCADWLDCRIRELLEWNSGWLLAVMTERSVSIVAGRFVHTNLHRQWNVSAITRFPPLEPVTQLWGTPFETLCTGRSQSYVRWSVHRVSVGC